MGEAVLSRAKQRLQICMFCACASYARHFMHFRPFVSCMRVRMRVIYSLRSAYARALATVHHAKATAAREFVAYSLDILILCLFVHLVR